MNRQRSIGLYVMAALYVLAGLNHFINPGFYKKIMPPWLPWHYPLIYISGFAEILLGVLLLPKRTRRMAAIGIIALLIAVFPANIQMLLNWKAEHHANLWIAVLRLPLQLVLIAWAYRYVRATN